MKNLLIFTAVSTLSLPLAAQKCYVRLDDGDASGYTPTAGQLAELEAAFDIKQILSQITQQQLASEWLLLYQIRNNKKY